MDLVLCKLEVLQERLGTCAVLTTFQPRTERFIGSMGFESTTFGFLVC